ncbi:gamma-glutamylcyclotransferase family protein [Palleronia sp. LCG004]|uniref:gamma-glutamylcyclotransferase family protein n=1 Tax=Palleronia sp. LCG004 TaxID=3079304 RepID=UPI0029427144|nr:gamma-glutamylcyclotransferase family protein [Palleronia sp. LCG004]WOI56412.1 gamma-glutamylcyclotransferase family protein [Palleronia sp. LCG004]
MAGDGYIGDLVFVYGTLRRGFINNEATLAFRGGAEFIAEGWVPGLLYSTGWYPALIEEGPGSVKGEVWRLTTTGVMAILDDYEGLMDEPAEYERVRREVQTDQGPMEAWLYLYIDRVDPVQLIPSGDWADAFVSPGDVR